MTLYPISLHVLILHSLVIPVLSVFYLKTSTEKLPNESHYDTIVAFRLSAAWRWRGEQKSRQDSVAAPAKTASREVSCMSYSPSQ